MRVAVAICSVGRPDALAGLLPWIARQTHLPTEVLLVVTGARDLPDPKALATCPGIRIAISPKGLARQRNRALDLLQGKNDAVVFLDDDYLPSRRMLEGVVHGFATFPRAAGLTGQLLADGIGQGGIDPAAARQLIGTFELGETPQKPRAVRRGMVGLYGCNMALRCSAIGTARFDQALPLYGWQEDVDFAARLPGEKIRTDAFTGVHLGLRTGRESNGRRLGYSQVANTLYLWRKGTLPGRFSLRLVLRNLAANHLKLLRPEPWVDRRGRAMGNWIAIRDVLRGRAHPGRILDLAE